MKRKTNYPLAILLNVLSVSAPVASGIWLILVYLQGRTVEKNDGFGKTVEVTEKYLSIPILILTIVLFAVYLILRVPLKNMYQQAVQDNEYDEFGMSKKKSYQNLTRKEREQMDLQKMADMERLLSSSVLKKIVKKGSENPEEDLNRLIGIEPVKQKTREMAARMKFEQEIKKEEKKNKNAPKTGGSMSGRHMVFYGSAGTGKAQPLYSKVLTPKGFTAMANLNIGDEVVSGIGRISHILGIYPQGKKAVYELTLENGISCRCSDEHLWTLQTETDTVLNRYRTLELKQIMQNFDRESYYIPVADVTNYRMHKGYLLKSITYIGEEECQCIYIDDESHTYITDNYIITHNTTVARIITGFLYQYGYIKENKCVEIDGNFLKAGSESGVKTKLICQKAFDGVLFIDEAYSIVEGTGEYGREVIATLIKEMEDNRDRFVLILAGYKNDMNRLLSTNEGFKSRIKEYLYFPDYDVSEMSKIFELMAHEQHFEVSQAAFENFAVRIEAERKLATFGNGRTVRNVLDESIDRHALHYGSGELSKFTVNGYPADDKVPATDCKYLLCGIDVSTEINRNVL